ncbi:hypothetical protein ACFWXK_39245 [Streptomyces sp. NPDC059070]|uniref:hypothetical protein n=1 Tax=Streptomyces sp. NPDC059070 TaxID=3346713 RepID=UPI0036A0EC14
MTHPLALVRALQGHSQRTYAQLVADTHLAMGFGHMSTHRTKVAGWETAGITPSRDTQAAMAHIHGVAWQEVVCLGWPEWLRLVIGNTAWLQQPWTHAGAVAAMREAESTPEHADHASLLLGARTLPVFTEQWGAATARTPHLPEFLGGRITPEIADLIALNIDVTQQLLWTIDPAALYHTARGDLLLISSLLSENSYSRQTAKRLHLLAACAAGLCAGLSLSLGEGARAERHFLVAARSAAAAGHCEASAACLLGLAYTHLTWGTPDHALSLLDAAITGGQRPWKQFTTVWYLLKARAHARIGDASDSARYLDLSRAAVASRPDPEDPPLLLFLNAVEERWVDACEGIASLHLNRPKQAMRYFTPLLDDEDFAWISPAAPFHLLYAADAQLATAEVEAAVHTAHRATTLYASTSARLALQCRSRFAPYRKVLAVKSFLEFLAEREVS